MTSLTCFGVERLEIGGGVVPDGRQRAAAVLVVHQRRVLRLVDLHLATTTTMATVPLTTLQ